ncbi:MAG: SsrA-binding protein SmpB [Candidatus Pacebacteria bacterium]|nr:SsrA-binding protein SmpB [Candidatus Paceibacterota bacterium]
MSAMLLQNKKVTLNYEILEKMSAGIELFGFEVKAVRSKMGSLDGTHITVRGGEAYLIGVSIPPFQPKNTPEIYNPERNRKLLLTKKELQEISLAEDKKGLTVVPLSMYNVGRKIKVDIAIVRGKKKYDKRETIKKRDTERDIGRTLKR